MAKYRHYVTVPFAGTITATIESDKKVLTPQEIVVAVGEDCGHLKLRRADPSGSKRTDPELSEWQLYTRILLFGGAR